MFEISIYRAQPVLQRLVELWMCAQQVSRCVDCVVQTLCCRCLDLQPFSNSDDDLDRGMITAESDKVPKFREEDMARGEPLGSRLDTSIDLADVDGDPDLEERQRRALQFRRQLSMHKSFGDTRAKSTEEAIMTQPTKSRASVKRSRPSVRASKINRTDFSAVHSSTKILATDSRRKLTKVKSKVDRRDSQKKFGKPSSDEVDQIHFSKTFHPKGDSCQSSEANECIASSSKAARPISAKKSHGIECSHGIASNITHRYPTVENSSSDTPVKHKESPRIDETPQKLKHSPKKATYPLARDGGRSPEFPMLVERSEIRRKYYAPRNNDDDLVRDHGINLDCNT